MAEGDQCYSQTTDREFYNNPEKWYIRYRWLLHAKRRLRNTGKTHLKVFTLPGTECFDVRLFKENEIIEANSTGFNGNLAFCEKEKERFAVIGNLLPNSNRFLGSYEDFVGWNSPNSSTKAAQWFPFDLINLDFTGPGFHQMRGDKSRVAQSILKTFQLQKYCGSSFSLFLTLSANPRHDDNNGKVQLQQCLDDNLASDSVFRNKFLNKYNDYDETSHSAYTFLAYHDFLLVTVPKIIIKYGNQEWFTVVCEDKLTYVGEGHTTRMVSFCFDCKYVGLNPTGYGGTPQHVVLQTQYAKNTRDILNRPSKDVNQLFLVFPRLKNKYVHIKETSKNFYGEALI